MQLFDYIFNVGGNYTATINGMTEATGDFTAKVESANNWVGKISSTLAVVDLARNAFEQIDSAVKTSNSSGITLDSRMHDLGSVAGCMKTCFYRTNILYSFS